MRAFLLLCLLVPIMAFEIEIKHVGPASPVEVMQARIMEKEITAFLECIRDILQNGDTETGLPPLDPLVVPDIDVDLNTLGLEQLTGDVHIHDVKASGHSGWNLKKLKISVTIIPIGAKVQLEVIWPNGDLTGNYDVDVSILGQSIKGAGNVNGLLEKLRITLETQVTIAPIQIKTFKVGASLASSSLKLDELTLNGVDLATPISDIVSEIPAYLVNNMDKINKLIKEVVLPILNNILGGGVRKGKGFMMHYSIPIIGKCLP